MYCSHLFRFFLTSSSGMCTGGGSVSVAMSSSVIFGSFSNLSSVPCSFNLIAQFAMPMSNPSWTVLLVYKCVSRALWASCVYTFTALSESVFSEAFLVLV